MYKIIYRVVPLGTFTLKMKFSSRDDLLNYIPEIEYYSSYGMYKIDEHTLTATIVGGSKSRLEQLCKQPKIHGKNPPISYSIKPYMEFKIKTIKIGNIEWSYSNINIDDGGEGIIKCGKFGRKYTAEAAQRICNQLNDGWGNPSLSDFEKSIAICDNKEYKNICSGIKCFSTKVECLILRDYNISPFMKVLNIRQKTCFNASYPVGAFTETIYFRNNSECFISANDSVIEYRPLRICRDIT